MTGPMDLPVLIQSLPLVQKFANAESNSPEIRRELFSPLLNKQVRLNQERVQEVDPKEGTEPVNRDGAQDHPRQEMHARRRSAEPEEEPQETTTSNPSPWAGNIVNVKI